MRGTSGSGTRKSIGTNTSEVARAVIEPTSNSTRLTIANSTTSAAMGSGWVSRFQCRNVALTTAATAYAVASAATTPRSRLDIGRGWRARRSPTKRSSPLITYELSVLTRTRVNPGEVLHHFRPGKLQERLQASAPCYPAPARAVERRSARGRHLD